MADVRPLDTRRRGDGNAALISGSDRPNGAERPAGCATGLRDDALLRAAFDALPLPRLILDRDGRVIDCNAAARGRLRRLCDGATAASVRSRPLAGTPDDRPDRLRLWWLDPDGTGPTVAAGVGWQETLVNGMRTVFLLAPVPADGLDVQTLDPGVDLLPLWLRALIGLQPVSFFASDLAGICRIAAGGLLTRFGLRDVDFLGLNLPAAEDVIGVPLADNMRRAATGATFDDHMTWLGVDFATHWAPWTDLDGDPIGGLLVVAPAAAPSGRPPVDGQGAGEGVPSAAPTPSVDQHQTVPGRTFLLSREGQIVPVGPDGHRKRLIAGHITEELGTEAADAVLGLLDRVLDRAERAVTDFGGDPHDERRYEAHIVPYHDGLALLTVTDVTDRLERDRARREAQRLEELGRLAAGVAHEINTPIQYIGDNVGFLQQAFADMTGLLDVYRTLLDDEMELSWPERAAAAAEAEAGADVDFLTTEVPQAASETLDGIDRVATIVRAMKTFGHPTSDEMAATDLNEVLRSALVLAKGEYKRLADVDTDFGDLPPVQADEAELHQVFVNFIVNAAHAIEDAHSDDPGAAEPTGPDDTAPRGRITVTSRGEGEQVVITIRDTGCGMSREVRQHIFDPFYTTKAVGRGTGQGLNFAHASIADRHNGTVSVESTEGEGTTFEIRFPVAV